MPSRFASTTRKQFSVPEPPLEDWLELLDAVQRLITRRRYQPADEELLRRQIRERFPDAEI